MLFRQTQSPLSAALGEKRDLCFSEIILICVVNISLTPFGRPLERERRRRRRPVIASLFRVDFLQRLSAVNYECDHLPFVKGFLLSVHFYLFPSFFFLLLLSRTSCVRSACHPASLISLNVLHKLYARALVITRLTIFMRAQSCRP